MTRKDFELIAQVLLQSHPGCHADHDGNYKLGMVQKFHAIAHDMADALASENPRFDRERFLKACGV